ncbi:ABC transporter permease [Anaerocolumna chitinilytica]|uniref:Putative multiple-sugar transport system permease YteP n=1 Tax=Anaerocolumna chitinilytica TaxID=1727145 RepID=A0A7I8DEZ6_9FIRM|nr:ABC transporter permease subunit [Anaerocolumna chitinilytica]BCJ97068.1 putative multiple-sugar transport system permease YteP [Anaerocolumna chitinilytica]
MDKRKKSAVIPLAKKPLKRRIIKDLSRNKQLYLLLVPGIISLVLFKFGPLFGMAIAFENFSAFKGITGSDWVGLKWFLKVFHDPYMLKLLKNTLILALLSLVVVFPIPIIFALFLNEVKRNKIRGFIQSLSFLPYFISAAVMVSILFAMLSPTSGVINNIIVAFGGEAIHFQASPAWFRPMYVFLQVWQTFGYSAIIYIAAITSIDPALYEAAEVDGAGRWVKMFRITLPSISVSVITMFIISVGNIFTVDLDRILLMYNSSVFSTADVIQTYVYRIAFESSGFPNYSYGTAVNLLKSILAFILVMLTNKAANKYAETRLF